MAFLPEQPSSLKQPQRIQPDQMDFSPGTSETLPPTSPAPPPCPHVPSPWCHCPSESVASATPSDEDPLLGHAGETRSLGLGSPQGPLVSDSIHSQPSGHSGSAVPGRPNYSSEALGAATRDAPSRAPAPAPPQSPGTLRSYRIQHFGWSPTPLRNPPRVSKPSRVHGLPNAPAQNHTKGARIEAAPRPLQPPPTEQSAAPQGEPSAARAPPDCTPSHSRSRRPGPPRAGPAPSPPPGAVESGRARHSPSLARSAPAPRRAPGPTPGARPRCPDSEVGPRGRARLALRAPGGGPADGPMAGRGGAGPGGAANHARGRPPPAPAP